MNRLALTRASTIGPIVDFVKRGGGSIERVFRGAQLPLQLRESPDVLIPLRDQFKLIEFGARELGDDALPARLSISAGIDGLGRYGREFVAAPSLGAAISCGNEMMASTLQSATQMSLTVEDHLARWTYEVAESEQIGSQKNAILAMGYILTLLRRFVGASWVPTRAELPGRLPHPRSTIEEMFQCDISGGVKTAVVFPAELLDVQNPAPRTGPAADFGARIPAPTDFSGYVQELLRLRLLERRPQLDWVARRLGMSVRSLQRHLREDGMSFAKALHGVIEQQAAYILNNRGISITEIAYALGYSDPAHFARAFTHWFGESPRLWRLRKRALDYKSAPEGGSPKDPAIARGANLAASNK
jgi:AraC-like DNA-binding protein